MGLVVLILVMAGAIFSLTVPWIGVLDGYACILFGPQVVWWWSFQGLRYFLVIAVCTFIGVIVAYSRGQLNFDPIKNKLNLCIFVWCFFTICSYFYGPYIDGGPGPRYFPPEYILEIMCKAFFFYFLSVLCITDEKIFKYLCLIIIVTSIYYIYWINSMYLSGHYGRLGGPKSMGANQYGDQNNMAMFFVISLPFLYYYGYCFRNTLYRYLIWLIIPFGWHALFLTGSRGGLLGLGVTMLVMTMRSPRKLIGLFLIPCFIVIFVWQAGPIMKERSSSYTSDSGEVEESAQGRLDSWASGLNMIKKHPISGVGVASYGVAFPDFSTKDPKEAHNTYIQIGAESGIIAMIAYISFLVITLKRLWCTSSKRGIVKAKNGSDVVFVDLMQNAVLSAWAGFAVCAFFLSLQVFEQFFYLAVLSNFLINRNRLE